MLEKRKKKILDQNYLLNKRQDARKRTRFLAAKHRYFLAAVLLSLLLLGIFYYFSPYSKVFHVSVRGNYYLKTEDILKESGITTEDRFLLVSTSKAERALQEDPLIRKAFVTKRNDNLIVIEVEEEKIMGYMSENWDSVIMLANDERVPLTTDNLYLIDKVPLIEGFTKEKLKDLAIGYKELSPETVNEISEIHLYPFSYDENMSEAVMRDGNYVFVSCFGIKMLENYYPIISSLDLSRAGACIYLDEVTNSGYVSACPWEPVQEPVIEETEED